MPVEIGAPAPPSAAAEPGGGEADLRALASGRPALLFFYKFDCGACEAAAPALARFAGIAGLAVAAVSQDAPQEALAFAAAHGWGERVRVLVDGEPWPASEAWAVRATPTFFLVAPGGRVEAVSEGWSRAEANDLAARAAALAGAAPVIVSREGEGPAFRPG